MYTLTSFDNLINELTKQPLTTPTRTYGTFEVDVLEDSKQSVTINTLGHNPKDITVDVTDEEVVEGIRLLAECEGIFGETSGGVTVAVTRKLLAQGLLDPTAETVIVNTGEGLKTLDAVATGNGFSATISPNVESVAKVIEGA